MSQRIRQMREQEGFTLIELLIVIVVLGILAAIVVFGVGTFRKDAMLKACTSDIKNVEVAAQAFLAKTGAAPTALSDLTGGANPYLKDAPDTTNYTISLSGTNATGALTAANGGDACP